MSSNYDLKDSGTRREFGTGAVRDMGEGKGRCDLLPAFALLELSKHFEAGALKYDAENWRKGIPLRVYLDSAIRHLFKFLLGMRDERHELAALWNIACLIETQHMIDRGILPATLGDLPDWHDPHHEPDGRVTNADTDVVVDGISYGGHYTEPGRPDFAPVETLDSWLGERFPEDPRAPKAAERAALAELTPPVDCEDIEGMERDNAVLNTVDNWLTAQDGPNPPCPECVLEALSMAYSTRQEIEFVDEPSDDAADHDDGLNPLLATALQPIEWADVPATFVVQGISPATDRPEHRIFAKTYGEDNGRVFRRQPEYTRGHADETAQRFIAGLPYADDLRIDELPQRADADRDPVLAITGHPLFDVRIINGDDVGEYNGPELCSVGCGCKGFPDDVLDPLTEHAYVVLHTGGKGDTREWFVRQGRDKVLFRFHADQPWRESTLLDRDAIKERIKGGLFKIKEVGSESC